MTGLIWKLIGTGSRASPDYDLSVLSSYNPTGVARASSCLSSTRSRSERILPLPLSPRWQARPVPFYPGPPRGAVSLFRELRFPRASREILPTASPLELTGRGVLCADEPRRCSPEQRENSRCTRIGRPCSAPGWIV